ncbi:MAG TPA: single-stranded-DNA-specific exonuclease RecJ [Cytophagales bacterium]|nr:single-stranded-DNA-specific exonuclease RecJ [Cytophagales bacterium]
MKRWVVKEVPERDLVLKLSSDINVSEPIAGLLLQRGVLDYDSAKKFFRPLLDGLHDPFLMKDMDKAVSRLEKAILKEEKILIYGDYDVDGTTSVSLFYGFLKSIYPNLDYYIPDRYSEGYGVSFTGIDWAQNNGISLIVSLDCGIKDIEKVLYAKEREIDFIICDHHLPGDNIPPAFAVLDPKRKDCEYPFKELSGCGVGFKLLQGFCQKNNIPLERLYPFLDLLSVSIASDIVPIIDENRIFTFYGLKRLNDAPRPGLKALIETAGLRTPLDISSVVFGIGPRINAAGRIEHGKSAVELLLSDSENEALELAGGINTKNAIRRNFDESITLEALQMIEADIESKSANSTVLFKNDWHKGVIGIVASRCIEKYYRPTIILTESNNKATGSARSVNGFDVYEAISECAELLDHYGGHMYAAGLTLSIEKLSEFKLKFEEAVSKRITPEQLIPMIEIDFNLNLGQINSNFYKVIKQIGPFGPKNMQPVFVSEKVEVVRPVSLIKEDHIKLRVKQGNSASFDAIGFCMGSKMNEINNQKYLDICYVICENEFRGERSLQLNLKDIKVSD